MELVHKISHLRELSPAQWGELVAHYLPNVASVALVLAITWFGANTVLALLPSATNFDWNPELSQAAQSAEAPKLTDFGLIASAHLFGEANARPIPQKTVNAPDTRLNLKLRGTVSATDQSFAHAIIADGGGQAKVYFIEDSLAGGAKLHEVYPDRVIIERAGTLETLRLPKEEVTAQSRAPSRRSTSGRIENNLSALQNRLQADPASFTEIVRPQPYMPNGQLKGYRVYPGRNRRAFSELGLRPGDLVTDINGQPLNNLQNGMEVFRSLGENDQIAVTIERDGSAMTLTLDSSKFNNAQGATQ